MGKSGTREAGMYVFATFESQFAPLGGLAAVMHVLPPRMAQLADGRAMVIAPFFRQIVKCRKTQAEAIRTTGITCRVRYGARHVSVKVLEHVGPRGCRTILVDAPRFFTAPCDCGNPANFRRPCNPYLNPGKPEQLREDALFFSAAVPEVLASLGYRTGVVLFLQDWETACVALTAKAHPALESPRCFLTLHNPYDAPMARGDWARLTTNTMRRPTVLSNMIPLLDGPVSTVSKQFAEELVNDPLHARVYAPHLQTALNAKGVVGVNNGVFGTLSISNAAVQRARQGDVRGLLRVKHTRRRALVSVLGEYQPTEAWGTLSFEKFDGPIFVFFGRDDPRQKGYDVAACAIDRIPNGLARYVFTPIPGDEGVTGLRFLKRLSARRAGEVKVFPFRMQRGYMELQRGASFLVMCSLYEPFGGATEGFASGTPVVARATGGLVQQITPYQSLCLTPNVKKLARRYHRSFEAPSGLLFRERELSERQQVSGWKHLVACGYGKGGDRVKDRVGVPLFDAMVDAAAQAIMDAITLYTKDRQAYGAMIYNGVASLERFSWDAAVQGYRALASGRASNSTRARAAAVRKIR